MHDYYPNYFSHYRENGNNQTQGAARSQEGFMGSGLLSSSTIVFESAVKLHRTSTPYRAYDDQRPQMNCDIQCPFIPSEIASTDFRLFITRFDYLS